jgi:hypothetical protein
MNSAYTGLRCARISGARLIHASVLQLVGQEAQELIR